MDPSYNNSFGQFGSGVVNSPIVSSGAGDVVLQTGDQKNNKKPFIVVAVVLLILAIVFVGVWVVINMAGFSKKELDSESYDKIKTSLIEQMQTMNNINNSLERGLNGRWSVVNFFQPSTKETINEWLEVLDASDELVQDLETIRFDTDTKLALKALKEYKTNSKIVLNKLLIIVDAFVNNNTDEIKNFAGENDLAGVDDMIAYSHEYKIVASELDKCKISTDNCDWSLVNNYEYGVGSNVEVVVGIFESMASRDTVNLLEDDMEKTMSILDVVEKQYLIVEGADE